MLTWKLINSINFKGEGIHQVPPRREGGHFLKKFSPPLFSFKEKDIEWKTFLRIDLECRSTLVEKGKIEGKERGENENNEAKGIKTKGTKGVRKRKKGKNGK